MKNTQNEYNIVSLGMNCMPRTILSRYLLKPLKKQGELSCVFDLAIHPKVPVIIDLIKNNFEGYFDGLEFDKKKNYFVNQKLSTLYMHDADFSKEDKDKLMQRYTKRIENFKHYLNNPKPTLFVFAHHVMHHVDELYDCIKEIRGDKPFEFVCINLGAEVENTNPKIHMLNSKYPKHNYDWWTDYDTKIGKVFEKDVAIFCENVIRNNLKCKVKKVGNLKQNIFTILRRRTQHFRRNHKKILRGHMKKIGETIFPQKAIEKRAYKKILVIKLGAIGDVVNSTIVHHSIKEKYPDAQIHFMTSEFIKGMLSTDERLDKVWGFDINKKDDLSYLINLGLQLRKEKFDIVLNFQKSFRTMFLRLLSGCKNEAFLNKAKKHSATAFYDSVKGAFIELKEPGELKLYVSDEISSKVKDRIADLPRPLIAINTGGEGNLSREGRVWPLKHWIDLGNRLQDKYGGTILVVGSKAELAYQKPLSIIKSCEILTGEFTLDESIALIGMVDYFISGDSGPLHIAGALGTKLVGLYGSTPPEECGPYNKLDRTIVAKYDCVGCSKTKCDKKAANQVYTPCMKNIGVDEVLSMVDL